MISNTSRDRWALACARVAEAGARPDRIGAPQWLEPPRGHFYADPFLVEQQGCLWVFFEDYDGATGRGHIAASPLLEFAPRPALVCDWHLSYPFLIQDEGSLYLIPEQHERGHVSLYRCRRFPDLWQEEAVLLPDFAGVDPTVVRHQGRYWMWVGDQNRRARDRTFVFHADRLSGPWIEHRQSPAILCPDVARPAGQPWLEGARWRRPAQDRRRTYGGAMRIYEVVELHTDRYQECEIESWEPRPEWSYPDGMHHVCRLGEWMVWDAKRFVAEL